MKPYVYHLSGELVGIESLPYNMSNLSLHLPDTNDSISLIFPVDLTNHEDYLNLVHQTASISAVVHGRLFRRYITHEITTWDADVERTQLLTEWLHSSQLARQRARHNN